MKTLKVETTKRTIKFISKSKTPRKIKKVWDILKDLWLDEIWTWKSNLSVTHDNFLYK